MHFLVRRAITYLVVLFVVLNIIFFLPRFAPGSAATVLASGSKFAPQESALISARLGLNHPLYVQYAIFWKDVFSWPPYFGVSYEYYPTPVTTLFAAKLGWTALLILSSLALSILITLLMNMTSSLRRGGKTEMGMFFSSISLNSIPIYWTGMVLLWVFGVSLAWLPDSGLVGFTPGTGLNYMISVITHAILPVATLTVSLIGEGYLILRGSSQEVLKNDYVFAAEARGLKDRTIAFTYILRNSLLPYVSIMSFSMASLVSRVILVEAIFGYLGVGDLLVDAIVNRDYPVIDGSIFFLTLLIIAGGLVGDIILMKLDPRVKR